VSDPTSSIYTDEVKEGVGLRGLWLGFTVGLTHQIIAYFVVIHFKGWERAVEESRERQKKDLHPNSFQ